MTDVVGKGDFFVVQSWMVTELQLSGNELLLYAVIYGFSRDGKSRYYGGTDYLCKRTGCARRSVLENLKKLTEKGLLNKSSETIKNVTYTSYEVVQNPHQCKKCTSAESAQEVVQNPHRGSAESAPNNKYIINNKRKYICAPTLFERFYRAYPRKRSRQQAERAFAKLKPTDELVDQMLTAIEKAKTSGRWDNVEYIPYPSTWLNAHGWLDDLTTDYSDQQKAVIRSYNDTLSDKTGVIDETIFTESRASAIDAFLTFSVKPNFWEKYFSWISENVDLPPHVGFDWMISRSGFTKVKGGQFARG